jgi:hypothetical protein
MTGAGARVPAKLHSGGASRPNHSMSLQLSSSTRCSDSPIPSRVPPRILIKPAGSRLGRMCDSAQIMGGAAPSRPIATRRFTASVPSGTSRWVATSSSAVESTWLITVTDTGDSVFTSNVRVTVPSVNSKPRRKGSSSTGLIAATWAGRRSCSKKCRRESASAFRAALAARSFSRGFKVGRIVRLAPSTAAMVRPTRFKTQT